MDQWKPVFSHILRNLRCGKMKNWKNLKNTYSCKQSLNLFGVIFIVIPNQGRHYYYKTEQNSYKSGQLLQITTTLLQITTVITQIKAIIINQCLSHLKNWFCFSVCSATKNDFLVLQFYYLFWFECQICFKRNFLQILRFF